MKLSPYHLLHKKDMTVQSLFMLSFFCHPPCIHFITEMPLRHSHCVIHVGDNALRDTDVSHVFKQHEFHCK